MDNSVRDIVPFYPNPLEKIAVKFQLESIKNFLKKNDEKGFIEYVQKYYIPIGSITLLNMELIHFCAIVGWINVAEILYNENPEEINKPLIPKKNTEAAHILQVDHFIRFPDTLQGGVSIHLAVSCKQEEMCKFLLNRNVNLRAKTDHLITVLMIAAYTSDQPLLELIIQKTDPQDYNARDYTGNNALHYAVTSGREEQVVALIIAKGVNPNCINSFGYTPLLKALMLESTSESVVRMILDVTDEAFINCAGIDGMTALHCATLAGFEEICRNLIEKNANPGAVNKDGENSLLLAVIENLWELAKLYTEKMSDDEINQLTSERLSVLQSAVVGQNEEVCQQLLSRGADYRVIHSLGLNVFDLRLSDCESQPRKYISSLEVAFQVDHELQEFLLIQRSLLNRFNVALTHEIDAQKVCFEVGVSLTNFEQIKASLSKYYSEKSNVEHDTRDLTAKILSVIEKAIWPYSTETEKIFEYIMDGSIAIISTGWKGSNGQSGHSVTTVIFENYFFLCNRSRGQECGVTIFKIKDHDSLKTDLEALISRNKDAQLFLSYGIKEAFYLKKIGHVPLSPQKVGNCTWTSPDAAALALFAVACIQLGHPFETALKIATEEYNQWNHWDRTFGLNNYFKASYHQRVQKPLEWGIIPFGKVIAELLLSFDMDELQIWRDGIREKYEESQLDETGEISDLCWAILDQDLAAIDELVEKTKVSSSGTYSPLHFASLMGNEPVVKRLTELGWTYHVGDDVIPTPAHLALKNGHIELTKWWISRMPNPNLRDQKGNTLLNLACRANELEVVRVLLEKEGIDPSIRVSQREKTSLMVAITNGFVEIAKLIILRSNETDLKMEDVTGNTAFHYAAEENLKTVCKLLLKRHLNPSTLNDEKSTPLILALSNNHADLAKWLIEKGKLNKEDLDIADENGWTAFHFAVEGNHMEICKMLLDNGADPKLVTNLGETSLMLALERGHIELATWLIHNGKFDKVDFHHRNKVGNTAFDFALIGKYYGICHLLIQKDV